MTFRPTHVFVEMEYAVPPCVRWGKRHGNMCLGFGSKFIRLPDGSLMILCESCNRDTPSISSSLARLSVTNDLLREYICQEIMES